MLDEAIIAALRFPRGRDPGSWIAVILLGAIFYLVVRRLEEDEPAEAMAILPLPLISGFLGSLAFAGGHEGATAWLSFAFITFLSTWVLAGFWLRLETRKRLLLAAMLPGIALGSVVVGKWLGAWTLELLSG